MPESPLELRASVEEVFGRLPVAPGHRTEHDQVGGRPALWVLPDEERGGTVLHLHGGGFRVGSPRASLAISSRIAVDIGARVLSLDYRLAPEHPFPTAVDDALAAYRWLLERHEPGGLAVVGESAGGGLAVSTLLAARAAGLAQPAAAVAMSPWLDLTVTADSYRRCAETDRIQNRARSVESAAAYLAGRDPRDPLASPLFADLSGLAPILVHAAEDEVLVDDAVSFADRVASAGGSARLELLRGVPHMGHVFWAELPPARRALDAVAEFLREQIREG